MKCIQLTHEFDEKYRNLGSKSTNLVFKILEIDSLRGLCLRKLKYLESPKRE